MEGVRGGVRGVGHREGEERGRGRGREGEGERREQKRFFTFFVRFVLSFVFLLESDVTFCPLPLPLPLFLSVETFRSYKGFECQHGKIRKPLSQTSFSSVLKGERQRETERERERVS
jgi:hypothetical protein